MELKTMKRSMLSILIAGAVLSITSVRTEAQGYNPFQIGASGGIAFPLSDLGDITNTGYNIAFAVGYKPQYTPIGVRAEAAYNQFGLNDGSGGNVNIPAFTGNLVYELPMGGLSPYAIGGVGLYRPNVAYNGVNSQGAQNRFGFNIGGGVKIPLTSSFETFVEARYNRVTVDNGQSLSFVPVTVGIMF
jgi:opacity protein-like surface antigen